MDENNQIKKLLCQVKNLKKLLEETIQKKNDFQNMISNMPCIIYRYSKDPSQDIVFFSGAVKAITGLDKNEFENNNKSFESLMHPDDIKERKKAFKKSLQDKSPLILEYRIQNANNKILWIKEHGQCVLDLEGNVIAIDGYIFNESEKIFSKLALQKANTELQRQAYIDGLTKISNRRKFDASIQTEWKRMMREKKRISLIICDIDFFKLYNDNYGHQAGDICLQKIAKAINKSTNRPGDLAARYGGEEFAIILPDTDIEGAKIIANTIKKTVIDLKIPHQFSETNPYVTLSFGISNTEPTKRKNLSTLIQSADKALYSAKRQGRNKVIIG